MIIRKMLNNNAVVCIDDTGNNNEVIVRGRGIAYSKNVGDSIDESKVEKMYVLSEDIQDKFQELIKRIPSVYFQLCDNIITYTKENYKKNLNSSIYISLTDHIYMAIERLSNGIVVKNAMLWEIKRFYKDEYATGLWALSTIKKDLNFELPEDEAGFIALHIVNAQLESDLPAVYDITKLMQEVSNIVKYSAHIVYDEDSVYYYRFITHLKFFAQRLFAGTPQKEDKDDFLETIKDKYKDGFQCVMNIKAFLKHEYAYDLSSEEQLYLTIHIEKIVQESKSF